MSGPRTGGATDAAREGARQRDGKFGVQPVSEVADVDLGPTVKDADLDVTSPGKHAACSCISAREASYDCQVHGDHTFKMRGRGCGCDFNPETTDGPEQDCPVHGDAEHYDLDAAPVQVRKVAVPKAARQMFDDAHDAGLRVKVNHSPSAIDVTLLDKDNPDNSMTTTWMQGDFYDEPIGGRLPFRTYGETTRGVRFHMANGRWHGQWLTPRSARQARLHVGLSETPTKR